MAHSSFQAVALPKKEESEFATSEDRPDPVVDAISSRSFGQSVKPNIPDDANLHMYDPHTGLLINPGQYTDVESKVEDERHERAAELQNKLQPSACVEVHGHATCPNADIVLELEKMVTAGLTETADISLPDMAACAFGTVDTLTDPIVSIGNSSITDLPSTSTLLHKSHIIPDMIDSLEETGIGMDIQFKNVQIFNGMIVDRKLMNEAPHVKLFMNNGETFRGEMFMLLLIELDSSDYLQWMIQDISADNDSDFIDVNTGRAVLDICCMENDDCERHKHVFLLFHQNPGAIESGGISRYGFDVHHFIKSYQCGPPVAAIYYESEIV